MQILSITYEFPPVGGGTGKSALEMARALTRMGHSVTVLTSKFGDLARNETIDGIGVWRIPVPRRQINYASAWEVLSFGAGGLMRIGKIRKRIRPDLILAYFTIPGAPIGWACRLFGGTPFVTLLRGQDVPGYPDTPKWLSALSKPVVRFLWRRSLMVTANSRGLADLARETMPGLEIPVVANGVDTARYRPGQTQPDGGATRILYVGRLRKFKGIGHLIDAVAHLRWAGECDCELRIAGHGPERARLEKKVKGLDPRTVRFLGRLEEDAVIEQMREADIFCNPSYGEGMPNAVLEAMACGLPVVLSDIGPHREMIVDGVEGKLVPPKDWRKLADVLGGLIQDEASRREMGRRARARTQNDFTWDQKARELMGEIRRRAPKRFADQTNS